MSSPISSLNLGKRAVRARRSALNNPDDPTLLIQPGTVVGDDDLASAPDNLIPKIENDGRFYGERKFDTLSGVRRKLDPQTHDAISLMVADALPQMLWSTLPDGYHDYYNAQWYAFTGVEFGSTDGDGWNSMFHIDDRERVWAGWQHCLATGNPYEVEYRLRRHDGQYLWMLGRALPIYGPDGTIVRWVGTCTDINDTHMNAARNELLTKELDHRIPNIFAIVGSLLTMEAREASSAKELASAMQSRLAALHASHRLARTPSYGENEGIELTVKSIIRAVINPYENDKRTRFKISGADIEVGQDVITALTLFFYELCSNAAKYGALSRNAGMVSVTTRIEGPNFTIEWVERGGPVVTKPQTQSGFGTVLTTATIEQQLGGSIRRHWTKEGIEVNVAVPCARIHNGVETRPLEIVTA